MVQKGVQRDLAATHVPIELSQVSHGVQRLNSVDGGHCGLGGWAVYPWAGSSGPICKLQLGGLWVPSGSRQVESRLVGLCTFGCRCWSVLSNAWVCSQQLGRLLLSMQTFLLPPLPQIRPVFVRVWPEGTPKSLRSGAQNPLSLLECGFR
jgi:hypothetical protein